MTTATATISIGRNCHPDYTTQHTHAPTHDEIVTVFRNATSMPWRMTFKTVTILATADGIGEYEGETEPCTIIICQGPADAIHRLIATKAAVARSLWAQECIGAIVQDNDDTLAYPHSRS